MSQRSLRFGVFLCSGSPSLALVPLSPYPNIGWLAERSPLTGILLVGWRSAVMRVGTCPRSGSFNGCIANVWWKRFFCFRILKSDKSVLVQSLVLLLSYLKSSKFPEGNALFASLPSCQAQLEACPAVGWAEKHVFSCRTLFDVILKKHDKRFFVTRSALKMYNFYN
jgi:hypothetical protein